MIVKIVHSIFSTDTLPIVGGATGALTQIKSIILPTFDIIIYTICIAAIGAIVGYLVKLFLDWLFLKIKK
jgi:hypothetical protein